VTARVSHDVDRGGAAQNLAAQQGKPAIVKVRLRLCCVAPVEHLALLQLTEAERDLNVRVTIAAARFEQQDACAFVFSQPMGENASCRPGPNDDVIISGRPAHTNRSLSSEGIDRHENRQQNTAPFHIRSKSCYDEPKFHCNSSPIEDHVGTVPCTWQTTGA
jgi:hypothetical protein